MRISLGKGSYTGNPIFVRFEDANVTIGKYCSIALNLTLYMSGNHRHEWITTYPFSTRGDRFNPCCKELNEKFGGHHRPAKEIHIGNDVWIGDDVTIMSGVVIGDGSCIGANSVVRSHIPSYSIVIGDPAVVIRWRFDPMQRSLLYEMCWWNWKYDKIVEAMPFLLSSDVYKLYDFYKTLTEEERNTPEEPGDTTIYERVGYLPRDHRGIAYYMVRQ
jgi:acetyltransferase-like isoleucine patch superfamily enzyme